MSRITDDQLERALELITAILEDLDDNPGTTKYRDRTLQELIILNQEIKENK